MAATLITPLEPGAEMFQRGLTQSFLAGRTDKARPVSEATEIFDTEFEDGSEFEEDSPNYSFESFESRRSQTTISTFEEVSTPRSSRRSQFEIQIPGRKAVEGPRGPHLFRSSQSSSDFAFEYALQMSPLLPKETPLRVDTGFRSTTTVTPNRAVVTLPSAVARLDSAEVRTWSAQQVASWMYQLGFDESIIYKFELHDITGAVLLDLQFEDLKELEIPSFGKRHQLWSEIGNLRENEAAPVSPSRTPFQDISRPCTRNTRAEHASRGRGRSKSRGRCGDERTGSEDCVTPITPGGARKRRGRKHHRGIGADGDVITPAESVSIVAIEQLLPKAHKCAKGERCAKWRKQQRQLARLQEEHGFPISPEKGGRIFIAGDPGNAGSATPVVDNVHLQTRPASEAVPSVVASSDLLGPGPNPHFALQEEALATVESRDPQENVKQFLTLQHINPPAMFPTPGTPLEEGLVPQDPHSYGGPHAIEQFYRPPSPSAPLEMFPPLHPPATTPAPHANLSSLPKLSIPRSASAAPSNRYCQPLYPPQYQNSQHMLRPAGPDISAFSPCRSATVSPGAGDLYRFGTPCSEMDAPLTAIPLGPVSRDASQSVPPNMQYRDPVELSSSRGPSVIDWRRPSFAMPRLDEGEVFSHVHGGSNASTPTLLEENAMSAHVQDGSPANQEPPMKPAEAGRTRLMKRSSPSKKSVMSRSNTVKAESGAGVVVHAQSHYDGVNHHGWMKKRHTRLLRHEWREHHCRLTGTQLAMHTDTMPTSRPLDTINVDQYAVGCSTLASNKLSAKLKALKLSSNAPPAGTGADAAAFSFQLVPAKDDGAGTSTVNEKKLAPGGKTHHFAVKTRDERIDWMRELMLAKALRAKGEGYEVKVNGSVV